MPAEKTPVSRPLALSPQVHDPLSTAKIHWYLFLSLLPLAFWGIMTQGFWAALVLAVSTASAVLADWLLHRWRKQTFPWEGSSFLWGLLIGLTLPPAVPLHIPFAASLFAVWVVKGVFGGLGNYWINPVLAARSFALLAWTKPMTTWIYPEALRTAPDVLTGPTAQGLVKQSLAASFGSAGHPMEILASKGFPRTSFDLQTTDWLNNHIFSPLNLNLPSGYLDLMFGYAPGSIGETSGVLILAVTIFLFARGVISWEIPALYFSSFAALTWIFGGLAFRGTFFSGDVLFQVFTGGFLLGVFFLATDNVTKPLTRKAMIFYALGAGILTFLLRAAGLSAEGTGTAILFMNLLVPLLDKSLRNRAFGEKSTKNSNSSFHFLDR